MGQPSGRPASVSQGLDFQYDASECRRSLSAPRTLGAGNAPPEKPNAATAPAKGPLELSHSRPVCRASRGLRWRPAHNWRCCSGRRGRTSGRRRSIATSATPSTTTTPRPSSRTAGLLFTNPYDGYRSYFAPLVIAVVTQLAARWDSTASPSSATRTASRSSSGSSRRPDGVARAAREREGRSC